jgi:NAD-dependent deacetylase
VAQLANTLQRVHGNPVQVSVITQNVDNLHERAGSTSVIHLHGSLFEPRCIACSRPAEFAATPPDTLATEIEPPQCTHCGGYVRPGVVWFGEAMPERPFSQAEELVDTCDAMLVIGTSGVVRPAADLPINAHLLGKFLAEINPAPSELSGYMRVQWPTSAAQGLTELLAQLEQVQAP